MKLKTGLSKEDLIKHSLISIDSNLKKDDILSIVTTFSTISKKQKKQKILTQLRKNNAKSLHQKNR